jgi:hypothetical protein
MAVMLSNMTVHQKHDLLITALLVLVIIPLWAEVILYPAFRVAGTTEVHIPNDVLRVGLGLAATGAISGALLVSGSVRSHPAVKRHTSYGSTALVMQ